MSDAASADTVVAFSGGVGGAKLVAGLARVLSDARLAAVVNTGDDFEHFGLHISPDIDSVLYALSGKSDTARGWGRADESWRFMSALAELSAESWFNLGDLDMATHVYRTWRLRQGAGLCEVVGELAARWGIGTQVMPMSDAPVGTLVHTLEGILEFQRYFVMRRCEPVVTAFTYRGCESAAPPPAALAMMRGAVPRAIVICPSNPFVSIAPIFAIPAWSAWLRASQAPVIAVSPFVGRLALKGPAGKMMAELGFDASTAGWLKAYGRIFDACVIDNRDADDARQMQEIDMPCLVTDTVMHNAEQQSRLAHEILEFSTSVKPRPELRRGAPGLLDVGK